MSKLPTLQPRGAITRAPQSSISGADVANVYQQVASAFDAVGQVAQKKALDDARIEGQQEVERDADGKPIVTLRENWTEAGRTYNRYHSQQVLAQTEISTREVMSRLQNEANGDPDAFRVSAKAYRDQAMSKAPRELRGPLSTMIEGEIAANHTGVVNQKYRSDMAMTKSTLLESLSLKDNDRAALARQGGVDTEEYKKAYSETRTIWSELTANPVFQISPREAELRLKAAEDRDRGEALLGEADRALDQGGVAEAQRLADHILTSPEISLSPAQRRQYSGLIKQSIKGFQSERRAAIQPLKDLAKDRMKDWDAGVGLDSAEDAMLIENIRQGDPSYASYLSARLTTAREVRNIRSMSDSDQAALLEQQRGGGGDVIDRIIGVESGGNATAKNPNSSASGAGQFINSTWLSMMNKYRPDLTAGKSASEVLALKTDGALSREMTTRYAEENSQFLRNQGLPTTDANVYLAHFLGPRGAAQVLKADPSTSLSTIVGRDAIAANPFLKGKTAADLRQWATGKMGGGSTAITGAAAKTLQTEVTADLRRDLTDWETRLGRGDVPDQESLNLMTRQLGLIDDQDLRSQYQDMFRNSDAFQEAFRASPAGAEAFLSSLDARTAGAGASLAELQIIDSARAGAEAAAAMKRTDGLGYAARAYANFPELPALDVNNPGSYGPTLQRYQSAVNIAQAHGEMTNLPAFRPAQADAVARMWQTGDPAQLNALTNAMASSLTPETLRATLTDKPIKEALSGAILSNDPVKHAAAMQQLDLLSHRVSMPQLESDFGKDAVDRLQDWQGKVRYFTPDETAEWLKQRNDPKWAERVQPLVTKGQTEARKVSAADIVDELDTNRWFDAGGPIDEQTRRMMMNDYVTLVGERNASLDDTDKAKSQAIERMQKVWGVTSVYGDRGGRVMPYPPESFYPEVNGSKDWIGRELQDIAKGRSLDAENISLVSDRKTEAAAQQGEMPGYLISVINPETGMQDLMTDEQGRPLRHFFDPNSVLERATFEAEASRAERKVLQDALAKDRQQHSRQLRDRDAILDGR